ncbi:hypothetical protein OU798_08740 [Prolixibacteraceae bacterium Z1-6]|uniref:Uncharacterized protein n=1 Tax=Draconibacterium aestuarii TaxID=2998507 RepID=A0A9X3FCK2_9BACT|nr:hypothetical protein [Prolixibacteraceae bacterium Z1-6]
MKKLFLLTLLLALFAACEKTDPIADLESDVVLKSTADDGIKLVGEHFNLNIIGVADKTMKDDLAAGNVIFVDLFGKTIINLQEAPEGESFAVLDKNGTDEDGALFQLPDPGFEPYVTELPYGFDTETDYSVYARPLGKPMTGATITTMAELSELAYWIAETEDKKTVRLWENLIDEYGEALLISWGEFIPNPITFERLKGKQIFQNVTAELLSVVYEILVTYDSNADGVIDVFDETLTFHVRIPIFDELLEEEYWKYDNDGLKLLQLRFYPWGTDMTDEDIEDGWAAEE